MGLEWDYWIWYDGIWWDFCVYSPVFKHGNEKFPVLFDDVPIQMPRICWSGIPSHLYRRGCWSADRLATFWAMGEVYLRDNTMNHLIYLVHMGVGESWIKLRSWAGFRWSFDDHSTSRHSETQCNWLPGWPIMNEHVNGILVGGFKHLLFSIIYGIILPIDVHIFQDG